MTGKTDHDLLVEAVTILRDVSKDIADHETRIRVLERIRFKAAGAAAAIGSILGAGGTVSVTRLLGH